MSGFFLLLILLLVNAVVTRRQLRVQVADQEWMFHTQQVLYELSQTESLIKDAETGQRGFLYTEDTRYLTPYDSARHQVQSHIDQLRQLTADNAQQQARINHLQELSSAKLSELAETISLYRSGHQTDAKALVLSGEGFQLMVEIRELVNEIGAEETSLSASRSITYQRSIRLTVESIYSTTCVAALGLLMLSYFILRSLELRERHALQVREREEWFRATLTSLGDAVIATDGLGFITFLNPIAEQLMGVGLADVKGLSIESSFRIFNETTRLPVENPVAKVIDHGHIVGLANHTVLERSDGTFTPIEDSAAPIRDTSGNTVGVVLVFRDATFERKAQELMRKTEKLAAAARLSATVAHEINNPLEAIGNLIYITKSLENLPEVAQEHLAIAELELERVAHITRQTLGFYRESTNPAQLQLEGLIESVLKIYSNKFKSKRITVDRDYAPCPPLHGLEGELKQVVANLISNAADAVSDGGTIRVRLHPLSAAPIPTVQLGVSDDGPGIPPELRDRIFEPFFTTKKDVGTGLGLWVSKEIIDRHGGKIEVYSEPLKGTAFNILLPLTSTLE